MGMMLRKVFALFQWVCRLAWFQLPLFVMLVVFASVPVCFSGSFFAHTFLTFLLPQTILISLLLCWASTRKRWIWHTIFVIANLLFFVELGCYFCQHMRFNSAIAILMLQTNLSESKEFIDFAMIPILKAMLCSIIIITTILLWNYYWKHGLASRVGKCLRLNNRVVVCIVGGLLALSAYYTPLRIVQCIRGNDMYWMRLTSMPDASTIVTYYYGFMDSVFNPEIRELDKLAATIEKTSVNKDNAKKEFVIVYVIGESFGRGRSSLFGYPMETNPNMKLEMDNGSLMVYDNVVSHSSQTINVYRYMLSMCDILGDSGFVEYPLLPSILKKCGYYVSYYDNQSVLNSAKIDFGCTFFLSNKDVQQQSIDEYNKANEDYDGTFTLVYQPRKDCARSLTIYHLMGQHVDYKSRYPADFAKFSAADYSSFGYTNDQAEKMAEYDNATRYNDYVLSKIIDNLRNDIAIMVYAPDHGDEIYDYRDCVGRYLNFPEESIRLLFEVPVMIWVSDKYKELYPDEVEMLRKNEHKAIYNSDLSHTILDIAGIETESFRPDLSLLRDGDGRTNRRILQNNFEYDANRDKIRSYKMRYEK